MAYARHIEYRFGISAPYWPINAKFEKSRWWRITRQHRPRDQNCNFPKFKMADGRHFRK